MREGKRERQSEKNSDIPIPAYTDNYGGGEVLRSSSVVLVLLYSVFASPSSELAFFPSLVRTLSDVEPLL